MYISAGMGPYANSGHMSKSAPRSEREKLTDLCASGRAEVYK
jgi:hypothetical protein